MKLQKTIILVGFFAFLQAHAQTVSPIAQSLTPPNSTRLVYDRYHDVPENDPSDPSTVLTLKKAVAQKDFAVKGTIKKLAENAANSLLNMFNPFRLGMWIMDPLHSPMTYTEILTQQPELFNYFNITRHRRTPQKRFGPTLINSNSEYRGISDRKFGYCWGFSTFVRFFTQVAFYDPTLPRPSLKKIYAKIDRVLGGEATVFEGFANLRELTLVPEVELYLKLAAMELWRARAIKFSGINVTLKSTNWLDFDEVEELLKDLETRLKRGEFPKIVFASLVPTDPFMGMNTDIHSVNVYRVERLTEHRARIHLWDINFYAETLEKAPKYLEIDSNHGIHYEPYFESKKPYAPASDLIGRVIIAPENDAENATMLQSLERFCNNKKTVKYCKRFD